MKRTITLSSVLVALAMLASCQKEQIIEDPASAAGVTEFTAAIEPITKTAIASDGKVAWTAGDEITVTDASSQSAVYVAASSGASTKFNLKDGQTAVGSGPYTAVYGDMTEQEYSETGANCPLAANSETTCLTFSCPYAVLKITATSEVEKTIGRVVVKNGDTHLSTLTCGDGVVLSSTARVFYIAMAIGPLSNLNITFETVSSSEMATKARTSAVTLEPGDLLPLTVNFKEGDWNEPACIAAGTMITMANGERKPVEELGINDVIRTVDHKTGAVSSAPVCFIWKTENAPNAFTLTFEDGVEVTVIQEHGFYDQEGRRYAFINALNAKDYFGHHFYDADNGRWLELQGCRPASGRVDAYAIVTSGHHDHLSNGILSMCDGSFKMLANIFEYDSHLAYDAARKAEDIARYGLTPLEKILEYEGFTEADYSDYNLQYLNVAIGKGLLSWDYVKALSDYCVANQIF